MFTDYIWIRHGQFTDIYHHAVLKKVKIETGKLRKCVQNDSCVKSIKNLNSDFFLPLGAAYVVDTTGPAGSQT